MAEPQCCPACQHSLSGHTGVDISIAYGLIFIDDQVVKVDPQQAVLARFLLSRSPQVVPYSEIFEEMWGAGEGPKNPRGCLSNLATRLERATRKTALAVSTHLKVGLQVRIVDGVELAYRKLPRRPRQTVCQESGTASL